MLQLNKINLRFSVNMAALDTLFSQKLHLHTIDQFPSK